MLLEVEHLTKSFGNLQAVKDVSFQVERGESYGLLGPNGAGKSTLISMIFGLIRPDNGDIKIADKSIFINPSESKRLLGYVPQEIALYGELSARENLAYWGRLYGLRGSVLRTRIKEVLEIVGLGDREKGRIATFSGGMKRRINIAAALLHHPEILIMDEPTVGIDPQSRNHILETVKMLNQQGMTVIYTSHYMEEVEYLCQRIGIIDHGHIIADGTVAGLRQIVGQQSELQLRVSGKTDQLLVEIQNLESVSKAIMEDNSLNIMTLEAAETLAKVAEIVARHRVTLLGVNVHEPNLEAVFLHLTGRALRD